MFQLRDIKHKKNCDIKHEEAKRRCQFQKKIVDS